MVLAYLLLVRAVGKRLDEKEESQTGPPLQPWC